MSGIISSPVASPAGSEVIGAAEELLGAARRNGAEARLLGGIAVALRCPSAWNGGPLARSYSDIDLVTGRPSASVLARTFGELGYAPQERFNAVQGHSRMMFGRSDGVHVDVFVDEFAMCHRLELAGRLAVHDTTIPLADLVLTKLQIADLNEKDVTDIAALLLDHELSNDEDGINLDYIAELVGRDWGWWRTISHNLARLPGFLRGHLSEPSAVQVTTKAEQLTTAMNETPKTLRWKARAKVGDRVPWREDPEESH